MQKVKEVFFSEKGMRIVNALFLLSFALPRSGLIFFANLIWAVYLLFCVKHAESKGSKTVYLVFLGIAVIMTCVNGYFLLRSAVVMTRVYGYSLLR